MILLYTLVALLFGMGVWAAGRRARSLERRYIRAAQNAEKLAKEMSFRGGNCSLPDSFAVAKRQFELGRLVQIRDRFEEKFAKWEGRAATCRRWREGLLGRKGRVVPYLLGAVDMIGIALLLAVTGVVDSMQLQKVVDTTRQIVMK
jgi:hypothetical protein